MRASCASRRVITWNRMNQQHDIVIFRLANSPKDTRRTCYLRWDTFEYASTQAHESLSYSQHTCITSIAQRQSALPSIRIVSINYQSSRMILNVFSYVFIVQAKLSHFILAALFTSIALLAIVEIPFVFDWNGTEAAER